VRRIYALSSIIAVVIGFALCQMTAAIEKPSASPDVKVRPERPRIFLRPEDLGPWRKRFENTAELKTIYDATRKTVMAVPSPGRNGYISTTELQDMALFYLAENRAKEPLAKAKQWMDYFADGNRGDYWTYSLITQAMSIAYDWTYGDLTAEERKRYGEAIVRYAESAIHNAPHDLPDNGEMNQVSDYYNQFYWHFGRTAFAAVALAGEDGFEAASDKYLRMSEDWLKRHMLPATNQAGDGGGWFESLSYNNMTAFPLAWLMEVWRTGTGEDLFPQSRFLPGNSAWVVHSVIPYSGDALPLDDVDPGERPSAGVDAEGSLAPLLAARYHDPYAQYFSETLFSAQSGEMNFPYLLWYDPHVPRLDFAGIDKGRMFSGLGQVNMRSGWGKDDTLAVYRAGRMYGGHGHYSAGHFLLYRKGNLLVEDGYYGVKSPDAHNTLYIGGEMRPLARSTPQHFLAEMDGTTFDYARITGYYHDPAFSRYHWIDSDLTRAYAPSQASRVARRFIFLPPRTVLVIDCIDSPGGVEKRFRLHAPSQPRMDDAGHTASWTDGEGKLFVRTLLPADASMTASRAKHSFLLSVSPRETSARETLAHLLYAADLDEAAPKATTIEASNGFTEILVETPANGKWAVLFRADGKRASEVTYKVPLPLQGPARVNHLIADLSGDSCQVTGATASTQALNGGPLCFDSPGGGAFTLKAFGREDK